MKHILNEGFDFNSAIENDITNINDNQVIKKLLLYSINKTDIKNIVKEMDHEFNVSINNINIDDGITINIYYEPDLSGTIDLIYNNDIVDVYLTYFGGTNNTALSECTLQILNYIKGMGISISNIINYDTMYYKTCNMFYLTPKSVKQILIFTENNYKINLVDFEYDVNDIKIDKIEIEMYYSEKGKENMLKNNIINVDKNIKLKFQYI